MELSRRAWATAKETGSAAFGAVIAAVPLPAQTALFSLSECCAQLSHAAAEGTRVRAAASASAQRADGVGWMSNAHCSSQSAPWQLAATNTTTTAHAKQRRKLHMSRLYSIFSVRSTAACRRASFSKWPREIAPELAAVQRR